MPGNSNEHFAGITLQSNVEGGSVCVSYNTILWIIIVILALLAINAVRPGTFNLPSF